MALSKTQNTILIISIVLCFVIGISFIDYYIKHLYATQGNVPYYQFDLHLVFILNWIIPFALLYPFVKYFSKKKNPSYIVLGISCLLLTLFSAILLNIVFQIIYNKTFNIDYNPFYMVANGVDRILTTGIPATFMVLGYIYFKKSNEQQRILAQKEIALKESKIKELNARFEPHFLFNNLNILSGLIDKNTEKSHEFISNLGSVYRYLVRVNNQSTIALEEELNHAKNYLNIINVRFNSAYILDIQNDIDTRAYLLSNTMQVLIENVVKHNEANPKDPLHIVISTKKDKLIVQNRIRKREMEFGESTQFGLNNLKQRYELSFDKTVIITEDKHNFYVQIPLLKE